MRKILVLRGGALGDFIVTLPALAYAVTYPTAIVGIIGTLLLLKQIFRVDPAREAADFAAKHRCKAEPLERRTLIVTNPNLDKMRLDAIPGRIESRVTISRVRHGDETHAATDATVIHRDDRLSVVGTRAGRSGYYSPSRSGSFGRSRGGYSG